MTENYKALIPHSQNIRSGREELSERSLARLKLEIHTAIDNNFWGNPNGPSDRPKVDPGAGGFKTFHFGSKGSR